MSQYEKFTKLSFDAMASNLLLTETEKNDLVNGLSKIPVKKVIDLSQYLTNIILPKINKSQGKESVDYKNFKAISDALIWALHVMSLQDATLYQLSNEKLLAEFYRKKCLFYEKKLLEYTTAENLLMQETFNDLKTSMIANETGRQSNAFKGE